MHTFLKGKLLLVFFSLKAWPPVFCFKNAHTLSLNVMRVSYDSRCCAISLVRYVMHFLVFLCLQFISSSSLCTTQFNRLSRKEAIRKTDTSYLCLHSLYLYPHYELCFLRSIFHITSHQWFPTILCNTLSHILCFLHPFVFILSFLFFLFSISSKHVFNCGRCERYIWHHQRLFIHSFHAVRTSEFEESFPRVAIDLKIASQVSYLSYCVMLRAGVSDDQKG